MCSKCKTVHNEYDRIKHDNTTLCPECRSQWMEAYYADAKQTTGKIDLTTVPPAIIESIAKVREHAINGKYKDPENWRRVPWEEYWRAMLRHVMPVMRDPMSVDDESGLMHMEHIACNVAFILEMWKGDSDE